MTEQPDINELFARDPLKLTDDDIDSIILEFRKKRAMFKSNPGATRSGGVKKLTAKEQATKNLDIDIDI